MPASIASSAVRTCLGDGDATFAALLRGECGAGPLRHGDPGRLNVTSGYHIDPGDPGEPFRAGRLLAGCARAAVAAAGVDPARERMVALVGTGLGEQTAVEEWALSGRPAAVAQLDFGPVLRSAVPGLGDVVTISNACSAGGHVLALAQDLIELGEADAVLVAAADTMTQSMLAMIGRVAAAPVDRVRPFDADRGGVLLGEGAAAVVLVGASLPGVPLARLLGTGLSCDAHHETAPDVEGICRAMRDAFDRAGRNPADVDLVLAHGTGTALNDPAECDAIRKTLLAAGADPLLTAVKGSVGHTSGTAALINLDVGIRCLATGSVPPVSGLRKLLDEGVGMRFVRGGPVRATPALVQLNAFGFGGVNAVTLLAAA